MTLHDALRMLSGEYVQFYSYVLEMTLQIYLKHLQVPSL